MQKMKNRNFILFQKQKILLYRIIPHILDFENHQDPNGLYSPIKAAINLKITEFRHLPFLCTLLELIVKDENKTRYLNAKKLLNC